MAKIIISKNVTLDGVVQDPTGEEGFRHGGRAGRPGLREVTGKVLLDEALGAGLCCWAGAATSSSPRCGYPGVAPWRTG